MHNLGQKELEGLGRSGLKVTETNSHTCGDLSKDSFIYNLLHHNDFSLVFRQCDSHALIYLSSS